MGVPATQHRGRNFWKDKLEMGIPASQRRGSRILHVENEDGQWNDPEKGSEDPLLIRKELLKAALGDPSDKERTKGLQVSLEHKKYRFY